MPLNAIAPSNVFSDVPTLKKSEFLSSIPITALTNPIKGYNHNSRLKCLPNQNQTAVEEAATETSSNKNSGLSDWFSTRKQSSALITKQYSNPFTPPSYPRSHEQHSAKRYTNKYRRRREPTSWTPNSNRNSNSSGEALPSSLGDDGREVVLGENGDDGREVVLGKNGIAYRLRDAPFEFQYSYTETPKVKPLALREAAFVPFGPTTMPRPWTGRAPLPPSKKKLREFDSFKLPPPNKKGVKHIQAPGPFVDGQGPKYVKTREEILGEPLTSEEVYKLVESCCHSNRQLNIGRDGLTHNMLENIHAHWKRRRVCKIKCKGVPTVDMDNVCNQLEEKTGGKVIHRSGGAVYLFRGRNYNYKMRTVFPLMIWKPAAAVYPRLIELAPGGLTVEDANDLRKKGQSLLPICKLGKNGVYLNLVKDVRDAFEVSQLVRINCQGLKPSDYKKIGAKLKDLVPCVLLSFEFEHILMWRGKDWKPKEHGARSPEAHLDRESIPESDSDVTWSSAITAMPLDEMSRSNPTITTGKVVQSNFVLSQHVADEGLGDKDGISANFKILNGVQHLTKNTEIINDCEVNLFEYKMGASSSLDLDLEELIESGKMKISSDEEQDSCVSVSFTSTDGQCLDKDSAYNCPTTFSSEVELEEKPESSEREALSDRELDLNVSVSVANTTGRCLAEVSSYNLQTPSSSKLELEETIEMDMFSGGNFDSTVREVSSDINREVKLLAEDSKQNSQTSNRQFVCGEEDSATSGSKQVSEEYDPLSSSVDHHTSLTADSSKKLSESYFPATETRLVSEEIVDCTDKEYNLYSVEDSELYMQPECAEATNVQENEGTLGYGDGNEFTENIAETGEKQGRGLTIDVLWEQAIVSGRLMYLDEQDMNSDLVHEKAIAFVKDAPAGPFFKRNFSHRKVSKPLKRNSKVKSKILEGQKPAEAQSNNCNRVGKMSPSTDILPCGGLPVDELAKLLAQ